MTLRDLVRRFRVIADDLKEPYLWATQDVEAWANVAERQACRRAPLLVDARTPEITVLAVSANDPYVDLDARVVAIRRAKASGGTNPLALLTVAEMDEQRPGWEDHTGTEIEALVVDVENQAVRVYPTQTASTTVNIIVQRLPLCDMTQGKDEPEIRAECHERLVDWMLFEAYSVDDIDKADEKKAAKHAALFVAEFGETDARLETFQRGVGQHTWQAGYFP